MSVGATSVMEIPSAARSARAAFVSAFNKIFDTV